MALAPEKKVEIGDCRLLGAQCLSFNSQIFSRDENKSRLSFISLKVCKRKQEENDICSIHRGFDRRFPKHQQVRFFSGSFSSVLSDVRTSEW